MNITQSEQNKITGQVRHLAIEQIDRPEKAMRDEFEEDKLNDLIASIKNNGLIHPITVRSKDGRFEIIAGDRRFKAIKRLGWTKIPAYIIEADDKETLILRAEENLKRADIGIVEEARYIRTLIQELNINQSEVAEMIGRSNSYVSERLEVLNYEPELLNLVERGEMTFSVAREFNKIDDENVRKSYTKFALQSGINPTTARKWRQEYQAGKTAEAQTAEEILQPTTDNIYPPIPIFVIP